MRWYNNYDGYDAYLLGSDPTLWYIESIENVPAATHTEYRYRSRQLIYTYYHTKTETLESDTEITATDNISNVQKWVRYIAK